MIDEKISIEELVEIMPASVTYLLKKGIKCIACGEPIWPPSKKPGVAA